jgi:hypothetical protein
MTTRTYKTRPWLWFALSLVAFIAIGCVHWIDMKGGNALFGASVLGSLREVLFGEGPPAWLSVLVPWLIGWIIVAAAVGWCLQSTLVLLFSRHEKAKPPA